jgi:hypothetical protein
VHYNFFQDLWRYRCKERPTGVIRYLRRIPGFATTLAPRLHFRWYHRHKIPWHRFPHALARNGKAQAKRVLRPVKRAVQWISKTLLDPFRAPKTVRGFWSDNWLEPTCKIILKSRLTGHALRLGGTAPIDSTLQVLLDGRLVKTAPLQANSYATVDLPITASSGKVVTLKFSHFVSDQHRRRLAFLLQDTNLFMEQDLN